MVVQLMYTDFTHIFFFQMLAVLLIKTESENGILVFHLV